MVLLTHPLFPCCFSLLPKPWAKLLHILYFQLPGSSAAPQTINPPPNFQEPAREPALSAPRPEGLPTLRIPSTLTWLKFIPWKLMSFLVIWTSLANGDLKPFLSTSRSRHFFLNNHSSSVTLSRTPCDLVYSPFLYFLGPDNFHKHSSQPPTALPFLYLSEPSMAPWCLPAIHLSSAPSTSLQLKRLWTPLSCPFISLHLSSYPYPAWAPDLALQQFSAGGICAGCVNLSAETGILKSKAGGLVAEQ